MLPARAPKTVQRRCQRFARDESGNLTVFSVFMFVGIVAIGGIGIDLMMNEQHRTQMQNALDSAVLAAADLRHSHTHEDVVRGYLSAHDVAGTLVHLDVDRTAASSVVTAAAQDTIDPLFLNMVGLDGLESRAFSQAQNSAGNVEISMVLDISGSMGWTHMGERKIVSLRRAASDFVDTVLNPERQGQTSINLVSYNSYTNIGPDLADALLANPYNCYKLRNQDFSTLGISFEEVHPRSGYHWERQTRNCNWSYRRNITVHNSDATWLKREIGELEAGGWTAIEVGMKWGLALLDPASNGLVRDLVSRGRVSQTHAARPAPYTDNMTSKVVVLMTDGENTVHSSQDAQLAQICGLARNEGVVIYTVAFDAPAAGVAAMQACASSDAHFFDVQTTDISSAFAAIAASISTLRLTQ